MEDVICYEEQRANAFRALSALFLFPSPEIMQSRAHFEDLAEALYRLSEKSGIAARQLWTSLSEISYQHLAVEFTRLFIGPYDTVAPPYGSYYLENKLLMGHTTVELMSLYVNSGLEKKHEFKDLPDHIAAEMEFAYYLIFNEVQLLKSGDLSSACEVNTVCEDFLYRFYIPWMIPFTDLIREESSHSYFKGLSDCLSNFSNSCRFNLSNIDLLAV